MNSILSTHLALSIVSIFFLVSCERAVIEGCVTDEINNPIENAKVKISGSGYEASTDQKGRFKIEYPPGAFDISIEKNGYTNYSRGFNMTSRAVFPLEEVHLIRIPERSPISYSTSKFFTELPEAELYFRTTYNTKLKIESPPWFERVYVSGPYVFIKNEDHLRFTDFTGENHEIYRLDGSGIVLEKGRKDSSFVSISSPLGSQQVEIAPRISAITADGPVPDGMYAIIPSNISRFGSGQVHHAYLFELGTKPTAKADSDLNWFEPIKQELTELATVASNQLEKQEWDECIETLELALALEGQPRGKSSQVYEILQNAASAVSDQNLLDRTEYLADLILITNPEDKFAHSLKSDLPTRKIIAETFEQIRIGQWMSAKDNLDSLLESRPQNSAVLDLRRSFTEQWAKVVSQGFGLSGEVDDAIDRIDFLESRGASGPILQLRQDLIKRITTDRLYYGKYFQPKLRIELPDSDKVTDLVFLNRGENLRVSFSNGFVVDFSAQDGIEIGRFDLKAVAPEAKFNDPRLNDFVSSGQYFATAGSGLKAQFIDIESGKVLPVHPHYSDRGIIWKFSSDGRYLAVAGSEGNSSGDAIRRSGIIPYTIYSTQTGASVNSGQLINPEENDYFYIEGLCFDESGETVFFAATPINGDPIVYSLDLRSTQLKEIGMIRQSGSKKIDRFSGFGVSSVTGRVLLSNGSIVNKGDLATEVFRSKGHSAQYSMDFVIAAVYYHGFGDDKPIKMFEIDSGRQLGEFLPGKRFEVGEDYMCFDFENRLAGFITKAGVEVWGITPPE